MHICAPCWREIDWRHDEAVVFGQHRTTARQVAWYGERAFSYTYSGIRRTALLWQPLLLDIKHAVETQLAAVSPTQFNSCLLNLYADGSQGMAWHSDDEKELAPGSAIASNELRRHPQIRLQTQTHAGKTRNAAATRPADCDARQHPAPLAARGDEKHQSARAEGEFDVSGDGGVN
jgi:alkylated DNA repair dioxygenase AlkB